MFAALLRVFGFGLIVVDLVVTGSVLIRVDDLVDREVLLDVAGCEGGKSSREGARYTGGKGSWLAEMEDLLGGFIRAPTFSCLGFEILTNRSIAPFCIPPFVAAFLAAAFCFRNFLGSRKDSS